MDGMDGTDAIDGVVTGELTAGAGGRDVDADVANADPDA